MLQDPVADLSAAFSGVSVLDAACFLRFIYRPEDAAPTGLAVMDVAVLAAVAGLAHKLDAGRLLAKIDSFLQGKLLFTPLDAQSQHHVGNDLPVCLPAACLAACPPARLPPSHLPPRVSAFLLPPSPGSAPQARMRELLAALQLAQHCQFQELEEQCLQLAADKLAAVGGHRVDEDDLAALDSATLARLLGKTLQSTQGGRHPARQVFDVQQTSDAGGGFTFAIAGFSGERDVIESPWVEVGGFEWKLEVYPGGRHMSGDRHGMPSGVLFEACVGQAHSRMTASGLVRSTLPGASSCFACPACSVSAHQRIKNASGWRQHSQSRLCD